MTRAELQQTLARVTTQRAQNEEFVSILRQNLVGWRKQETERNPIAQALLWAHNEAWAGRIESLAVALEQHGTTLRNQEAEIMQTLSALSPDDASAPAPLAKPKTRRHQ
jgi:hypothetical protein